ncbi:MAG: ABC transporter ATP-binding protein, partial [Rhodospirillales bacterium]|nr:ABC transporter ATP-binding protein [Rhodospirillales bacterium]
MLTIEGVHTFYGNIEALRGVDVEVREGEIVTLIGANGAGKSTLLMTICGQPHATRGRIAFEGQDITRWPTHAIIRAGIAQSPEGRRIFARMSVYENLLMGATVSDGSHVADDLRRVYALFPILQERADQRGGTLSGGEQQMLAIGRALMSRPRLLLLDEPSLGLAPMVVKQIFRTIAEINREQRVTV